MPSATSSIISSPLIQGIGSYEIVLVLWISEGVEAHTAGKWNCDSREAKGEDGKKVNLDVHFCLVE